MNAIQRRLKKTNKDVYPHEHKDKQTNASSSKCQGRQDIKQKVKAKKYTRVSGRGQMHTHATNEVCRPHDQRLEGRMPNQMMSLPIQKAKKSAL